jgi:18S rRNA (adenine1779-N6/adenine1780-N6)-dimethyltransferase
MWKNYRTYCAMNNIPVDTTIVEASNGDADADMDVDDETGPGDEEGGMDLDGIGAEDDEVPSFFKELAASNASKDGAKTPSKRPKTKVAALVREKVRRVLEDVTGLAEKRARMLDETDFLKLLLGEFTL